MSTEGLFIMLRFAGVLIMLGGPALLAIGFWQGGRIDSKDVGGALGLSGFGVVLLWAIEIAGP